MAIRGVTKNIALTPIAQKNMDERETYIPYHIDLRNGKLTDAGNWDKRNGFGEWRDVGVGKAIDLLIPEDDGYCATEDGRIFKLTTTSQTELTGQALSGASRPIYTNRNDKYIICDGGNPVKISGGVTSYLGGTPPNARFVDTLGSYVLMAGQTDTALSTNPLQEVRHSAVNNEEDYTGGTSGSFWIKMDGDIIRNLKVLNEKAYVFKGNSIEVWVNIGSSSATFVRQQGSWIDTGCGADYSVVKANNTLYWFGNDRRFYMLQGGVAKIISDKFEKYVYELLNPSGMYGFDFKKEHVIRWFVPIDGKCFVYDYKNPEGGLTEDNTWDHGQWERMPINSYMELNGKQYFGDYDPTGKIFEWSDTYKSDNGKPIRNYRKLRIRPSGKGNNVRLNRIGFDFARGSDTFPETSIPVLFWRYRTDNGNWEDYRTIELGQTNFGKLYYEEFPGAVGLDWDIEVVHTDNSDFLLKGMDATFQEMGR